MNGSKKSFRVTPLEDELSINIGEKPTNDIEEPPEHIISTPSPTDLSGAIIFIRDSLSENDKHKIIPVLFNDTELVRVIRSLPGLSDLQKRLIELRYFSLLAVLKERIRYIDIFYHSSRAIISLGSISLPALLSIQSPRAPQSSIDLYWVTWTISLIVTILHNFSALFRFDKKFYGIHGTYERLKSEGWQFLELSGHYSGHHGHYPPTHQNQFTYFMNAIERISAQQVQEEYNATQPDRDSRTKTPLNNEQSTEDAARKMVPSPADSTMNRASK